MLEESGTTNPRRRNGKRVVVNKQEPLPMLVISMTNSSGQYASIVSRTITQACRNLSRKTSRSRTFFCKLSIDDNKRERCPEASATSDCDEQSAALSGRATDRFATHVGKELSRCVISKKTARVPPPGVFLIAFLTALALGYRVPPTWTIDAMLCA